MRRLANLVLLRPSTFPMLRKRLFRILIRTFLAAAATFAIGIIALVWDGLHDEIAAADLAVVFGNTVYPDGTPSPRLAARLDRAVELFRQGLFPLILVSGATGDEGRDEAVVMRDYLLQHGIPPTQVIVDSDGWTTFATAMHAHRLMQERGLGSALVISQYFHVPRARLALRRSGITRVYSAHARYFELRDIYSVPRELVGFLRYMLRSYDVRSAKA
jgi:vancomycin permeability regulator SanA